MPVISVVFATGSGSRFLIRQAESGQALAHLPADRGKAMMGLDEGLSWHLRGPLRRPERRRFTPCAPPPRRHRARPRDLTLVIGIFAAGAYLHEPVRDEVTLSLLRKSVLPGRTMSDTGDAGAQSHRRNDLGRLYERGGDGGAVPADAHETVTAASKPEMLVDRPQQRRGDAQQAVKLPCRAAR